MKKLMCLSFVFVMLSPAYASVKKRDQKVSPASVFNPLQSKVEFPHFSLEETPFSPIVMETHTKEELLRMLQSGEVAVSKAFYIKDKKPVCVIDTVNKKELVPEFAHPARHSSIALKEDFPVCGLEREKRLARLTSGMALEGT